MERWIQMHYQIKEREQALEIARDREFFYWFSGFYITSLLGCFSFYQRTRRPVTLLPMVPLSFVMGYYADLAYGSKIHRIKGVYICMYMHVYISMCMCIKKTFLYYYLLARGHFVSFKIEGHVAFEDKSFFFFFL